MHFQPLPIDQTERWYNDFFKSEYENTFVKANLHYFCEAQMHTHDFYELNFVLHGNGKYYFDTHCIDIKTGNVLITPPDIYHGYLKETDFHVYNLCIHTDYFKYFKREIENMPNLEEILEGIHRFPHMKNEFIFYLSSNDLLTMQQDLDLICECQTVQEAYSESIKNNIALKILSHLCLLYAKQYGKWANYKENNTFAAIIESIRYMKNNMASKITVDDLAKSAHMSRSSYIRHFEKIYASSPMSYLRNLRLNEAKNMLAIGNLNKSVIAQECGFYDASHLAKCLRD